MLTPFFFLLATANADVRVGIGTGVTGNLDGGLSGDGCLRVQVGGAFAVEPIARWESQAGEGTARVEERDDTTTIDIAPSEGHLVVGGRAMVAIQQAENHRIWAKAAVSRGKTERTTHTVSTTSEYERVDEETALDATVAVGIERDLDAHLRLGFDLGARVWASEHTIDTDTRTSLDDPDDVTVDITDVTLAGPRLVPAVRVGLLWMF